MGIKDYAKIKKVYAIVLVTIAYTVFSILLTGCFNQSAKEKDTHKINQKAIEEVLRKSLTCPSLSSLETEEGLSIIGKELDTDSKSPENSLIEKELESMYKTFLTDKYYDIFIRKHALTFEIAAVRSGYEITVNSINVYPKENDPIGYSFKVNVTYGKDTSQNSTAEISGSAQCIEEGKLSYINYIDDGGLLNNMKYNTEQP